MNPLLTKQQGMGILTLESMVINGLKQINIETYTKKKFVYPSHMQLSFYADHLETFTSSSELSLNNKADFYTPREWTEKDLPKCYTAVNNLQLMLDKRITVILWLTNEYSNQEVIGQVTLKMNEIL